MDQAMGLGLSGSMTRRRMLRLALGTGAVAAAGGAGVALRGGVASADYTGFYRTTTAVNQRSGASTRHRVITVIPGNAMVTDLGRNLSNGFRYVAYQGVAGWVYADYLTETNGGSSDPPVFNGTAKTTTDVNFRSGPSNGHKVLRVLPTGTLVAISDRVENGYRYVEHNGQKGYVWAEYLGSPNQGPQPGYLTTTTALNLRAEPNTGAKVLLVLPANARVRAGDELANGFRRVTYNGTTGWAYNAYLR